jgi:hypothetical protein
MKCFFNHCNEEAEVYLGSVEVWYCRYHFWEIAYELLGFSKLKKILGRKKLREIYLMLGIMGKV